MQRTNLNVAPYFDDYNEDKNFHRILVRPRPIQARELNQMQSILQNQIEKMGDHIFQEGAMVIPGGVRAISNQDCIGVDFASGSFYTDISNVTQDMYVVSKVSGLTAKLSLLIPVQGADPVTMFIDYVNSGSNQEKSFAVGEACGVYINNSDGTQTNLTNIIVNKVAQGCWVKIQDGVYFVRGFFVNVEAQNAVVSKYTSDLSAKVGFKVTENIVDETMDSSLYSNAFGYPNFKAPGAARLQIVLTLTSKAVTDNSDQDFIEIVRYDAGQLQSQVDYTTYSIIDRSLAQRTYEEAGNFVVTNFPIEIKEHLLQNNNGGVYTVAQGGDATEFVAALKPGIAYVQGYRVDNVGIQNVAIPKARDTGTYNNAVVGAQYGPYLIVQNMYSLPDIDIKKQVQLLDNTSAVVGTTRIRAVRKEGTTTYRVYIFDTQYNTGKNINNVAKLQYTDASNLFHADLIQAVLFDSSLNTTIFPMNFGAIKTLKSGGSTDTTYSVIRSFTATTNSSGIAAVSVGANELFGSINNTEYLIAVTGSANTGTVFDSTGVLTLTGSPLGSGLSINLGSANANKTIKIIAPVIKSTTVEKSKTLTTVTDEVVNFSNVGIKQLAHADIFSIVSITDATTQEDLTQSFILDNGQRNNYYQNGTIKTFDGSSITRNLLVTYQYFVHSSGDYFTIDSYGGMDRAQIPTYTSSNGVTYNLADCIDFRPLKDASGNFTSVTVQGEVIKPGDNVRADITYYLPRVDSVYVDSNGSFSYVKGISSAKPVAPAVPSNAMKLYELSIPAYTPDVSKIQVKGVDNRRYTMRDIGSLDNRITNLEYYTSLNALENKTNNTQVIDPVTGNSRFKNGLAVDGFNDFSLADLSSSEWSAAIDVTNGGLNPAIVQNGADLTATGNKVGNVFLKSYTESATVSQPFATRTINVNPYAVFSWNGSIKLTPNCDFWQDVKYIAPIVLNVMNDQTGGLQAGTTNDTYYTAIVRKGSIFGNGPNAYINVRYAQHPPGFGYYHVDTTTTTINSSLNVKVQDNFVQSEIIPFMRSILIRFDLYNFRPFTQLYPFWDGVDVSADCYPSNTGTYGSPIITDANGHAYGYFLVPNRPDKSFRTGTSIFRFTDSATNSTDANQTFTSGEVQFQSGGSLTSRQDIITNTTTLTAEVTTNKAVYNDPIAQTFIIPDNGGCFVSKVSVYFATKDANIPITLQIREVENGTPTSKVVTEKTLNPSSVNVSADASLATDFVLDEPTLLTDTKEYALVLIADTQGYNVYISQLGEKIIGMNAALAKQPNLGVFLTSSNASTWSPNQTQDLKFTIYRAVFSTADEQVVFSSNAPVAVPLSFNAIQTVNGSSTLTVKLKSHGLKSGDKFTLANAIAGNGLQATDINGTWTCINYDIDSFSFVSTGTANATGTVGGSSMTAVVNYPFSIISPLFQTYIPQNGSIVWEYQYKYQSSRGNSGWIQFDPTNDVYLPYEGVALGNSDLQIRATLKTSVDNLTPCVDVNGALVVLVSPRVNSDINNPVYRYVTKAIKFNNPNTAARFWVSAKLPGSSTMHLYYKPIDNPDQDLTSVAWSELLPVSPIVNDSNNFLEYEYDLANIGSFVGYVVKIVMLSNDPCNYPVLNDFRSVALA